MTSVAYTYIYGIIFVGSLYYSFYTCMHKCLNKLSPPRPEIRTFLQKLSPLVLDLNTCVLISSLSRLKESRKSGFLKVKVLNL